MLIKRGRVEIIDVKKDNEHDLDDETTRKAMDRATQKTKTGAILSQPEKDQQNGLEN